jgi:membrane fusion protein (multidrug efflux system)
MNEPSSRPQQEPQARAALERGAAPFETGESRSEEGVASLQRFKMRPRSSGPAAKAKPKPPASPLGESGAAELAAPRKGAAPGKWLAGAALVAALVCAGAGLAHFLAVGRFIYSTDDAYVRTDLAIISPKISGYVEEVAVVDNQHVVAGQVLARIDAGDYALAVASARQRALTQDATIARIGAQAEAQKSTVAQMEAQLASTRAELARAEADLVRIRALSNDNFATRQRFDQAQADRDKAVAAVAGASAALAGAKAQLVVLQTQGEEAARTRAELATAVERAERDRSFTEIKAPFDGVVGNRAVEPGQFAQPGVRLMALAPDGRSYVEANFKETQLDRLAPGQKTKVRIDAFGGKAFDGVVESIAPASGAEYSLLPPENATGNFTKITQRFPVRIRLQPPPATDPPGKARNEILRAGLSVVVDVDTRGGDAGN